MATEAIVANLSLHHGQTSSMTTGKYGGCIWVNVHEKIIAHTFSTFRATDCLGLLPKSMPIHNGIWGVGKLPMVGLDKGIADHLSDSCHIEAAAAARPNVVLAQSAISEHSESGEYDVIVTDPPYYDAIPYSDLMDFFLMCG